MKLDVFNTGLLTAYRETDTQNRPELSDSTAIEHILRIHTHIRSSH